MRKRLEPVLRFFRRLVKTLGWRQNGLLRRAGALVSGAKRSALRFFMGLVKSWDSARRAGLLRQLGAWMRKEGRLVFRFFRETLRESAQRAAFLERAGALALMVLITVSSVVTVMAATHEATVVFDGNVKKVEITSPETDKILLKAGVAAGPNDLVARADDPDHAGDVVITVRTAKKATVAADGGKKTVTVHWGDTVGQALSAAGVGLGTYDLAAPGIGAEVGDGTEIAVTRRYRISVTADGKTTAATVKEGSVSDALRQAGVALGAEDILSADADAKVGPDMEIAVSRVSYKEVTENRTIPFQSVTKNDSSLSSGTKKVQTQGKNGSESVVVRQKLVDGKVVGTQEVGSTVVEQPVNQVTLVGTKKRSAVAKTGTDGTLTDLSGNQVKYKKVLTGKCSTYTGGGWTSTGKKAAHGLVAVNPSIIPYGTRLYICSPDGRLVYGYAVAADTGGAAMRGIIIADLYFDTYAQCMRIGTRTMNVYIL